MTLEKIEKALETVGSKFEITEKGIVVTGKVAGVKTKLNKGLKEQGFKIAKDNGYFGEYTFKHIMQNYTTGGFDIKEENGTTIISSIGGTGYAGL